MPDKLPDLPFQPIRNDLYSSKELLEGYSFDDPQSMARTPDFQCYRYFVRNGRAAPQDPYASMMEGLHDNSIARSMYGAIARIDKPTAAIMGGHREARNAKTYRDVVTISKKLSEAGFLMASGGGPGAMEATHLGALLAGASAQEVDEAIALLAKVSTLPDSKKILDPFGNADPAMVAQIHAWAAPAVQIMQRYPDGGESLAVPTWHYGHEPISPLATHVAKYFLNSIREDVLLALATNGIIFTQGRAGTLQEIFQDAAQNYYADPRGSFSPMVFLDKKFWQETLPVEGVLKALFVNNGLGDLYTSRVLFTDDPDQAVQFLIANQPHPQQVLERLTALGFAPMLQRAKVANRTIAAGRKLMPLASDRTAAMESADWGMARHKAIATAAAGRLRSAAARAAVQRICAAAGVAGLGAVADWADKLKTAPPSDPATRRFLAESRNRDHGTWHYVNLPLGVDAYDPARYPTFTRPTDVVHMLLAAAEALRAPGPQARFEEINALRWIAHLVGDLHQPVHVGCGFIAHQATDQAELVYDPVRVANERLLGDRGGNQIKLPGAGSIHTFWDSQLGADTIPSEAPYTAFDIADVERVVHGWATATLMEARKAYLNITIRSYVPNTARPQGNNPGEYEANWEGREAYEARCAPIVAERMSAAASNMAALLDAIWP